MVLPRKLHLIVILCHKIRRIAIKKGVLPVVLPDERLKVFILDDRIRQTVRRLPDQVEGLSHIKGLTAKGCAAASIAVPDYFVKCRRPLDIPRRRAFQKEGTQFLELQGRQVMPCQLQFLRQESPIELLSLQKPSQHKEFIPSV